MLEPKDIKQYKKFSLGKDSEGKETWVFINAIFQRHCIDTFSFREGREVVAYQFLVYGGPISKYKEPKLLSIKGVCKLINQRRETNSAILNMTFSQRFNLLFDKLVSQKRIKLQKDMAEKLEVQPATIQHLLGGDSEPRMQLLTNICKTFPVNPTWLILGEGRMFRDK